MNAEGFFIFFVYVFILAYLCLKIGFFRRSGLKPGVILFFFFLRIALGCIHNWIAWRYFPNHGDIWNLFNESQVLRNQLAHNLPAFRDNILPPFNGAHPLFTFISYFQYQFIINLNLLFDFISFDNFYINTLLFSFFGFWGNIALFRVLRSLYPDHPLAALVSLMLPSTIFWTACLHKEGILYMSLGFLFFYFNQLLKEGFRARKGLACLFFLLIAFIARSPILFIVVPGLLIWGLKANNHWKRAGKVLVMLGFASLLLVLPALLGNHFNLLYLVWERNMEFRNLEGHSRIFLPALDPHWLSYLNVFPRALRNGFFEPLPGQGGQALYLIFSIELMIIWLLIIYALLSLPKSPHRLKGFDYAFLLIALLGMLLIGYTVPFAGAIVRYRSLFLPFLLIPFLPLLPQRVPMQQATRRIGHWFFMKS